MAGGRPYEVLHVWQRDAAPSGFRGFDPHVTAEAREAEAAIRGQRPAATAKCRWSGSRGPANWSPTAPWSTTSGGGSAIIAPAAANRALPGGLREIVLPGEAVSRRLPENGGVAAWSGLPIRRGQRFVEIGCCAGGRQPGPVGARFDRDRHRSGPGRSAGAGPSPVPAHSQRGADVRRREFRNVDWLAADMNVAPRYTLDTVETIVTHPSVDIRGLLLTLETARLEAGRTDSAMDRPDSRLGICPRQREAACSPPPGDLHRRPTPSTRRPAGAAGRSSQIRAASKA